MLGIFKNKSDHPLANLKSAQTLLDDLPKTDAVDVLNEIAQWIEALFDPVNEFRIDHQFAVLRMLDEAAHPQLRKIMHGYFAPVPPSAFQENRLWGAMNQYLMVSDLGYLVLIIGMQRGEKGSAGIKPNLPLVCARGIYAVFGRMECAAVRYAQTDTQLWQHLAQFYACAEAQQCLDEPVSIYAGLGTTTTLRRMLAGVLVWHSAGNGSLNPVDLRIAKRLSIYLSNLFSVSEQCQEDSIFVFDLNNPSSPVRVKEGGTMYPPGSRFIGVTGAARQLDNILKTLGKNLVPDELNLGVAYSAGEVAGVVQRLAAFCQMRQPVPRPPRRKINMKVSVLNGFFNMIEEANVDLNLNDPSSDGWEVEDISANGLRCVLREGLASNVKIGSLVGLQPEKALHWGVGIVRRLRRDAQNNLNIGIRILSNKVSSVVLHGHDGMSADTDYSALLLEGAGDQSESLLLVRQDIFSPNQSPTMAQDGKSFLLLPVALVERGVDFDLVRYRKMAQEGGAEEAY